MIPAQSMESFWQMLNVSESISFLPSMFSVALYVLSALGLYTIAKRRAIANPWLAWLPYGNMWILGSIADQYQSAVHHKKTGRRKVLLALEIATTVAGVILVISFVGALLEMIIQWESTPAVMAASEESADMLMWIIKLVGKTLGMLALVSVPAIVKMVFSYMCCYDLYRSCNPENATLFLVLSIIFNFLEGIFLFICKDKDEGMPSAQILPEEENIQ